MVCFDEIFGAFLQFAEFLGMIRCWKIVLLFGGGAVVDAGRQCGT